MALKPCRECRERVCTFAAACPKCGKKHPTTGTTDYILAFAVIVAVIAVFAISGSADQQSQPDLPKIGSTRKTPCKRRRYAASWDAGAGTACNTSHAVLALSHQQSAFQQISARVLVRL